MPKDIWFCMNCGHNFHKTTHIKCPRCKAKITECFKKESDLNEKTKRKKPISLGCHEKR
jgi:DNA-directed RNA polymerase subunit RPC12/RpoP